MGFWERRRQKKLEALHDALRSARQAGDPQAELRALDQLIDQEPGDLDAFLAKAEVLLRLDRRDDAQQLLTNLAQWPQPEARERVGLVRARLHLEAKEWSRAWSQLPRTRPGSGQLEWLAMALRCCYELQLADDFRRLAGQHWKEPGPDQLKEPATARGASTLHTLLGSFLEDTGNMGDPAQRQAVEAHFRRALELWPENQEAAHGLRDLLEDADDDEEADSASPTEQAPAAKAAPGEAAEPEPAALRLSPGDEAVWVEATLDLVDRRHQPAYLELLRDRLDALRAAGPAEPGKSAGGGLLADQFAMLFRLMTGQTQRARSLLEQTRSRLASSPDRPAQTPELDFLEGMLLLQENQAADAVRPLNQAREQSDELRPECFPRLIVAHVLAKDRDGVEWIYGRWEKWLESGLEAARTPDELGAWDGTLFDYLELADATGRLQSFRLQNWIRSLLQRGLGGSRSFQLLYEADGGLRVTREGLRERFVELLHRYTWGLHPRLAAVLGGPRDVNW